MTLFWGVHGHPAQPSMAECYSSSNPPERKVNTYGSVAIEATAAAIARDFIGHPLLAFRKTVEWRDLWKVELYAICHTVEMASRMGIRNLWVESDSLYAVNLINSQYKPHWEARNMLLSFTENTRALQSFRVTHCWRESNRAADFFAGCRIMS